MGPDSDSLAVTDHRGRVYGAENLVVADSSLFPTCPRGNIHFPVVAVAEKIADGLI
jgi:choline dehydrogenase-like flavoprotein